MKMAFRAAAVGAGLAGAMTLAGPPAWGAEAPSCRVAPETFEHEPALSRTFAALEAGGRVTIVAIGGASTLGRAAALESQSWPARLEQELARRYPKATVKVFNRGVARETAAQMHARFERDAFAEKPDLVIWETGTTDAVRSSDVDAFMEVLQKGIGELAERKMEVLLMNPQFSRRSDFIVNFNRYIVTLRGVADISEVPLFPRHEIMRGWAEAGVFNFGVTGKEQRRELAIRVYACIGQGVADMITRKPAGEPAKPSP
jgi:hypothetical protein